MRVPLHRNTHKLVKDDFDRGATIPRVYFPTDAAAITDASRLTLVVVDPDVEWTGSADERPRTDRAVEPAPAARQTD